LRIPVAFFLLAAALSVVYHLVPDTDRRLARDAGRSLRRIHVGDRIG
jgi:hypothetical protein